MRGGGGKEGVWRGDLDSSGHCSTSKLRGLRSVTFLLLAGGSEGGGRGFEKAAWHPSRGARAEGGGWGGVRRLREGGGVVEQLGMG